MALFSIKLADITFLGRQQCRQRSDDRWKTNEKAQQVKAYT